MSKKPVHFETECPKCGGVGTVTRNEDNIVWFDCHSCLYSNSWHSVSALKKNK